MWARCSRLWKKREGIGCPFSLRGFQGFTFLAARSKKKNASKVLALGRLLTEVPSEHCTTKYKFVKGKRVGGKFLWPGMAPKAAAELPHSTNAVGEFRFG